MKKPKSEIDLTFEQIEEEKPKPKQIQQKQKVINLPKVTFSSENFYAVFLRKINGKYVRLGIKKIKATSDSIEYFGTTFPLRKNENEGLSVAYQDGKRNLLFFDFDGKVLDFSGKDIPISVRDLTDLVTKNIVAGIFARIGLALDKQDLTGRLLPWIIGGIMGGAIGYIIRGSLGGA